MQRRKIAAAFGGILLTIAAAAIALSANLGLFGLTDSPGGPGDFPPVRQPHPTAPIGAVDAAVPTAKQTDALSTPPRVALGQRARSQVEERERKGIGRRDADDD